MTDPRKLTLDERILDLEEARKEDTRLVAEIEKLGGNVQKLNDVLTRVDQQQAILHKLQTEIVPRDELKKRDLAVREELFVYRQRLLRRVYTLASTATLLVIAASIGAVTWLQGREVASEDFRASAYVVCQARSDQAMKIQAYLDDELADTLARTPDPAEQARTRAKINRLRQAFPSVPCDGLKPT